MKQADENKKRKAPAPKKQTNAKNSSKGESKKGPNAKGPAKTSAKGASNGKGGTNPKGPPSKKPKLSAEDAKLETVFIELCNKYPEGLESDVCDAELNHIPMEKRKMIVNNLMNRGRLRLWTDGDGKIVYKLLSTQESNRLKGLLPPEQLVYQTIGKEQNQGIWIRDLRARTGIPQQQIQKILKNLTARKLIKCEKSIAAKNKKFYMLYELEPAKEMTGGAWYNSKGEFDDVFVDSLYKSCQKCVARAGRKGITVGAVADWVRKSGIFTVTLKIEDIAAILQSLAYDGAIEQISNDDEVIGELTEETEAQLRDRKYREATMGLFPSEFTTIPCSRCPVASQCAENSIISPYSCEYFTKWMSF